MPYEAHLMHLLTLFFILQMLATHRTVWSPIEGRNYSSAFITPIQFLSLQKFDSDRISLQSLDQLHILQNIYEQQMKSAFYKFHKPYFFDKQKGVLAARHNTHTSQTAFFISPISSFKKSSNSWGRSNAALNFRTSSLLGKCFLRLMIASLIRIVLSAKLSLLCIANRTNSSVANRSSIISNVWSVMLAANTTSMFYSPSFNTEDNFFEYYLRIR